MIAPDPQCHAIARVGQRQLAIRLLFASQFRGDGLELHVDACLKRSLRDPLTNFLQRHQLHRARKFAQVTGDWTGLIEQSLLDPAVGVDAAVAQEGPVGAVFVDPLPNHVGEDGFFAIDARLGQDLAARGDDDALAPGFDPVTAGGRFVADAVYCGDKAAVRDGVAALDRFPGRMLGVTVFRFLGGMPADRGRINKISAPRRVVRRPASGASAQDSWLGQDRRSHRGQSRAKTPGPGEATRPANESSAPALFWWRLTRGGARGHAR